MASAEMADRIAILFLEDMVGELAGSVRPFRHQPPSPPAVSRRKLVIPQERPGKVTQEIHAFIWANRMSVAQVQSELERKFGITLQQNTIYKIWNGWKPIRLQPSKG
jgi:hypothetical protein